jgi:hypothetical protein
MKTATLPAVRVEPETRAFIESVLNEGESLSTFIEDCTKRQAIWRKEDQVFHARAIQSSKLVKAGKMSTYSLEHVMAGLRNITMKSKRAKLADKPATNA